MTLRRYDKKMEVIKNSMFFHLKNIGLLYCRSRISMYTAWKFLYYFNTPSPRTGLGAETKATSEKQTEKLALHDSDSVYVSADRSWRERGVNSGMGDVLRLEQSDIGNGAMIFFFFFFFNLFALGGSPTPHPISLPTSFCM